MPSQNDNNKTYGIEKFEGNFDKEEIGVTIIPTKTLNDIRSPECLGIYVYLLGRPSGWKLNIKQLCDHFQCGKDKMYRILNWLIEETLITCTMIRQNGRFTKPHYRVLLHRLNKENMGVEIISPPPIPPEIIDSSPFPENTDTVVSDVVSTETYKTYNINNINNNNSIVPKGTESVFSLFWNAYPVKKGKKQCEAKWNRLKLDAQIDLILLALKKQIECDKEWIAGYIPHPLTYLNGELWNDEIAIKPQGKSSTTELYM